MLEFIYTRSSRFLPMDITRVMLWNIGQVGDNNKESNLTLVHLDSSQMLPWVDKADYELSNSTIETVDHTNNECIGAFINDTLVGYIFFGSSPVDASRNSGGSPFYGIGLEFSSDVRYLYKALVLPDFRGRGIVGHIMNYAAAYFRTLSVGFIVTTTDWINASFLRASSAVGFKMAGTAGEFVVFGKHLYILPNIAITENTFIRLLKPENS